MIGCGKRTKILTCAGAIAVILAVLLMAGSFEGDNPDAGPIGIEATIGTDDCGVPVVMELASKLVRSGRVALQSDRPDVAARLASRALFLSDGRIGRPLEEECEERMNDLASRLKAEMMESTIAGEHEESLLLKSRIRSMTNGGEGR